MSFREAGCSVILLQESLSSVLNKQIHSDTQFMIGELIAGESISVCIHSYSNHTATYALPGKSAIAWTVINMLMERNSRLDAIGGGRVEMLIYPTSQRGWLQ